jgi:hypothetical protein
MRHSKKKFTKTKIYISLIIAFILFIHDLTLSRPFDERIFYLPYAIYKNYTVNQKINENMNAIINYWNSHLSDKYFFYFCWNPDTREVLYPVLNKKFQSILSEKEVNQFKQAFDKWQMSYNAIPIDNVLVTKREMMLFKLILMQRYHGSYIQIIDNVLQNNHSDIDIRFYIFKFDKLNKQLSYYYQTYSDNFLYYSNYITIDASEALFDYLKDYYNSDFSINIELQGYFKNIPLNEMLNNIIILERDENSSNLTIDAQERNFCKIIIRPLTNIQDIEKLECNSIYLTYMNNRRKLINSMIYEDLLNKSTLEEQTLNNAKFILNYMKTSNFEEGSCIIDSEIESELNLMKKLLFQYATNNNENNHNNYRVLYIELTGYADYRGQHSLNWQSRNYYFSQQREISIRNWFQDNLSISNIQIIYLTSNGCDSSFFNGEDRNVEIKAWLR